MTPTIAAILGRFNGDREKAFEYCLRVFMETVNDALAKEYYNLAMHFGTTHFVKHPGMYVQQIGRGHRISAPPQLVVPISMTHEGSTGTSWT